VLFDAAVNGDYILYNENTAYGAEIVPLFSTETACSSTLSSQSDMDFIVDSGASINIMSTKSNHLLSNSRQGTARISGFASNISARADRKGVAHLYFYNPSKPHDGTSLGIEVSTVVNANHNLLSVSHMCKKLGFTCTFAPEGQPEGFSRKEADGTTTRIPVTYYPLRKLWIVHFTAGSTADDAKNSAINGQHTICSACSAFDTDFAFPAIHNTDFDTPDPVPELPSDMQTDDTDETHRWTA
jgi:hypothetical protein